MAGENCTVAVFDMRGQELMQQRLQGTNTISLSQLPTGQYLLRIMRGDAVETLKLIKN